MVQMAVVELQEVIMQVEQVQMVDEEMIQIEMVEKVKMELMEQTVQMLALLLQLLT
jgi:hypothetical protein